MSLILMGRRRGNQRGVNVAALPLASRQRPDWNWYANNVRNAAAGTRVVDPVLGSTMLKLTSATSPVVNSLAFHDYSNGGPQFSLGWGQNNLNTTTVIEANGRRLVDLIYNNGSAYAENWRLPVVSIGGDLRYGFSRVTPRLMYVTDGGMLRRINTETNTEVTGGVWPKNLSVYLGGASTFNWVQVARNDVCIAMQPQNKSGWLVFYPSTDTVRYWTKAELDANINLARFGENGFDEAHLSDDGTYAEVVCGAVYERKFLEIASGRFTAQTGDFQFTHSAAIGDSTFAGIDPGSGTKPFQRWDVVPITVNGQAATAPTNVTSGPNGAEAQHTSAYWRRIGGVGEQYACIASDRTLPTIVNSVSWTVHSGSIYVCSTFSTALAATGYEAVTRGVNDIWERASNSGTATITRTLTRATSVGTMTAGSFFWDSGAGALYLWPTDGAAPGLRHIVAGLDVNNQSVALVKMDGSEIRNCQHTYTAGSSYEAFAKAHISQDGVWVMWSTDHGVPGGRTDVLIHVNPVS